VSFAPPPAGNLDDGYRTISGFMDERLRRNAQGASTYLDASGQAAFKASGAPALVVSDEPALSRYFVVFGQPVAGTNGGLRFVVRLVLAKGNVDITAYDEVLVLQRDPAGKLLVHQVSAGSRQPVGKGPEVISTQLDRNQVRVAFNADLQPANAPEVVVKDSSGRVLDAMATYSGRTYTLTLPPLTPGATYRVSVLPGVKDISGRSIAAEYDLDFVAPAS
jgi:hypothetical protein